MKHAFEHFKYAEAILIANQQESDNQSLLSVTCNNLGCYYKKVGKFHGALSYLRRALKMEVELNTHEVTLAGTHLNICAVLSKLEKHDKAVQHALSALELIEGLMRRTDPAKVTQDDYSVLAIAYHNVATERDFLKQYDKAASAFRLGFQVAQRCLGEDHPLAITLGRNCDAVLQKSSKLTTQLVDKQKESLNTRSVTKDPRKSADNNGDSLPGINSLQSLQNNVIVPMPDGSMSMAGNIRKDAIESLDKDQKLFHEFGMGTMSTDAGASGAETEDNSLATTMQTTHTSG